MATADPAASKASVGDKIADLRDAPAFQGYSCMLNQANIKRNNNKFYFMKIAEKGSEFYVLTHWGRVGENGRKNSPSGQGEKDAVKDFCTSFKKMTGDKWESRHQFQFTDEKYTLLGTEFLSVPLAKGSLSSDLIEAGLSALAEVEAAIKNKKSEDKIADLTSHYYTLILHDFGRNKPPVLQSLDAVRQEKEMLTALIQPLKIELTDSSEDRGEL